MLNEIYTREEKEMHDTEEATYLVTAKLRVTGDVASIVTEEHIEANLRDKLQGMEVTLSGEYYGDFDEEWELSIDDDIELYISKRVIEYSDKPYCEACGENYDDYGVTISTHTGWCPDCAEEAGTISDKEYKAIKKELKKKKKAYYQKKLKELEE